MATAQRFQTGTHRARHALIALALLSGLAACDKEDPPSAPAAVPGAAGQPTPARAEPGSVVAVEKHAETAWLSPDEVLVATLKSRFADAGLAGLAIDIVSSDGAVTLYGAVDSTTMRDRVARLAASVAGVKSVANKLVIARGS